MSINSKLAKSLTLLAGVVISAIGLTQLSALAAPAPRSTIVVALTNAPDSLLGRNARNLLISNVLLGDLTTSGFNYVDDKGSVTRNTAFGTYAITKSDVEDFQVRVTVAKKQAWSDGTPIDAVDLLLAHVITSSTYASSAGIFDSTYTNPPAFDSSGYNSWYSDHIIGDPILSSDKMSLTYKFDSYNSDWERLLPRPFPVHALERLADNQVSLGTAAANLLSKAQFLADYSTKNTTRLSTMGAKWSSNYALGDVDVTTNPLLLVANGGFRVTSAQSGQSVTLVKNAKYTSGPAFTKTNPVSTIVLKSVAQPSDALSQLAAGAVDVVEAQDSALLTSAQAMSNAKVTYLATACYEHLDLRTAGAAGTGDTYLGAFAGNDQRALDLRRAFLLTIPRAQILASGAQTINPTASVLNSNFVLSNQAAYAGQVASNGISEFTNGTQASRVAQALSLVQKYYPDASASNSVVSVSILLSSSPIRILAGEAIKQEAAKAGFLVTADPVGSWSSKLEDVNFDGAMFTWCAQYVNRSDNYLTSGGNNHSGWSAKSLDRLLYGLTFPLAATQISQYQVAAEKQVMKNYWTLPLYQRQSFITSNKTLVGLRPNAFETILWNFWELHY